MVRGYHLQEVTLEWKHKRGTKHKNQRGKAFCGEVTAHAKALGQERTQGHCRKTKTCGAGIG